MIQTEGCFGSYSINFMVYTFTKTKKWEEFQKIQDEIMLKIGNIIIPQGAEIAFPPSNVELTMNESDTE